MDPTSEDYRRVQTVAMNRKVTIQRPTKGAWLFSRDGTILLWWPSAGKWSLSTDGDTIAWAAIRRYRTIDDLIVLIREVFGPEEL